MTLVRFKGSNHPQQIAKRGPRPEIDDRATPPEVFDPLNERFRFTIDVAALPHNAKLPRYFTPEMDGLRQDWSGERVWCNPPFSSIEPWVEKASSQWCPLVVMMVPANRTEQGWWQRWVEPHRDLGRRLRVEFLPGRTRFILAGETEVLPDQRPPFGCCLLIWASPADTPPS